MNMEAANIHRHILLATETKQRSPVISELTTCVGEVISPLVSSCNQAVFVVFSLPGYNSQYRPLIACFAADFGSAGCITTLKRFVLVLGVLAKSRILQTTNANPSDKCEKLVEFSALMSYDRNYSVLSCCIRIGDQPCRAILWQIAELIVDTGSVNVMKWDRFRVRD